MSVLGDAYMAPWYIQWHSSTVYFPDENAKWIWSMPDAATTAPSPILYHFNRTFTTASRNTSVLLYIIADDAALFFLNDTRVSTAPTNVWYAASQPLSLQLPAGSHRLAIRAWNSLYYYSNPAAGLMATLVNVSSGQPILRTDGAWTASYYGAGGCVPPLPYVRAHLLSILLANAKAAVRALAPTNEGAFHHLAGGLSVGKRFISCTHL